MKKAERPVMFKREAEKQGFALRSLHLGPQFLIAGSAIALLIVLATVDRNTFATRSGNAAGSTKPIGIAIGLEHEEQAAITMLVARKGPASYTSIGNDSSSPLFVSVPSGWDRIEVTGATLQDVKGEIPVFGFRRWTLPPHASMKLTVTSVPDFILFDNGSTSVATVDLTTVDLPSSSARNQVVMVQTQTNVELWKNEE
jgi:hypothetical protein